MTTSNNAQPEQEQPKKENAVIGIIKLALAIALIYYCVKLFFIN